LYDPLFAVANNAPQYPTDPMAWGKADLVHYLSVVDDKAFQAKEIWTKRLACLIAQDALRALGVDED
jgi:hypothetical protein